MSPQEATRLLIAQGQDEALKSLVASGYAEKGVASAYLESRQANRTTTTQREGTTSMDVTEKALLGFAKGLLAGDRSYGLSAQDFEAGIATMAKQNRRPGESYEQSFTRMMTETPEGNLFFKASLRAPRAEPRAPEPEEEPPSRGEAHDEMQRRADRYHAANPHLSAARAYVDTYMARENAELRNLVIAEHLSPRPRAPAGRRLPYEDPNRNAAVRETMARTRGP